MLDLIADVKRMNTVRVPVSRSSGIANTLDQVQNIISRLDIVKSGMAGTLNHSAHEYVGTIPPITTDYPNATIGSIYHEFQCDGGAVAGYRKWYKSSIGWQISLGRRARTLSTFGAANSQFDVTLRGNGVVRYTHDGTGTAPAFIATGLQLGDKIVIGTGDFTSANQGTFVVVGLAATYIEVVNANGVAESNIITDGSLMTSYATIEVGDDIILTDTGVTTTTLPAVATNKNKVLTIKNSRAATNTTVAGNIDGATNHTLTPYSVITVVSDGTTWQIINKYAAS